MAVSRHRKTFCDEKFDRDIALVFLILSENKVLHLKISDSLVRYRQQVSLLPFASSFDGFGIASLIARLVAIKVSIAEHLLAVSASFRLPFSVSRVSDISLWGKVCHSPSVGSGFSPFGVFDFSAHIVAEFISLLRYLVSLLLWASLSLHLFAAVAAFAMTSRWARFPCLCFDLFRKGRFARCR